MSETMEKVVSLTKRRGFVYPSSEIYGGLEATYDYGPLGVELKRLLKDDWWENIVRERENVVGLDASILMAARVWEASGHVAGFNDPLVDCKKCKARFRQDKLEQSVCPKKKGKRPGECGGELTEPRQFNLMFKTKAGPVDEDAATIYLRPETAQGIFVNFKSVMDTTRVKIPFGIAQIGKAFRNEIVTGNNIFRMREFEQMEMEFFVAPGTDEEWFDYWQNERLSWWQSLGVRAENLRIRPHRDDELAHYARACGDVEFKYPWGWDEVEGIANRTDYDLKKHQEYSGRGLAYRDEEKKEWVVPYVIEPSMGVDRCFLTVLCDAYEEEVKPNGETRTVLHLHPKLAPVQVGVFPLVKKEGMPERAEAVYQMLKPVFRTVYDKGGTVGKRYSRNDEIGTPFCVTIDADTLTDGTVTIRDRDTMEQERVAEDQLIAFLADKVASYTR
ncbi:MAG: glycine--tRNA ligase [Planctomycetota bacterium]|nr:glycine--tRNA ligase [Planctomycetota bacterium]